MIRLVLILMVVFPLSAQDLLQHRWKERVVVITSDTFGHPDALSQYEAFRLTRTELDDRSMVVYHITSEGYRVQFGREIKPLNNDNLDFDFSVKLIGLDGGEKYTSQTFEPAEVYYALIDRMPMRRSQMRKRVKKGG